VAAPKHKPIGEPEAPGLRRALERITVDAFLKHSRWEDVELIDADLALEEALEPRLSGVRIDGGDLGDMLIRHLVVEDSELLRVNAANVKAEGAVLRRVLLSAARVTGANLTLAEVRDVTLRECRGDFVSFNRARLENVRFVDCNLREVDFTGTRLDRVRFDRCDLTQADFAGATFRRCEMRECTLDDARGVPSLAGVAMPYADVIAAAAVFAGALGVTLISD
jgi:uncharacterized protein YjbI with pentapeptide repeats